MRALVQRVDWAEVEVAGRVIGLIRQGLLVYAAAGPADGAAQVEWMAEKLVNLRIFEDAQGKLNLGLQEVGGELMLISNFTLLGDARKGRRPSFDSAAPAGQARPVHEALLAALAQKGVRVAGGEFGADMRIRSQAAGPVNLVIDSPPPSTGPLAAADP
jgi:D-tyrosyl-tRNA(Tyr) deacylase